VGSIVPDVDRWLRETNPTLEPAMRRITEIVLGADSRMQAYLKNGTVQLAFEGNLAAFVQPRKPVVSLMFYRGAAIAGDFPHLEGDGPTARFMRFADIDQVDERAAELGAIVRAWCQMQAPA
jgi:hypothetical protein